MTRQRLLRLALQIALFVFVVRYLATHWSEYHGVFEKAAIDWGALTLSSLFVLVAYVLLIQTWRQVVEEFGERLEFTAAMRIWFVSNLGKYIPGKVWSIAAMGTLSQEQGISPIAAVGSSVIVQLVNLVTGFAVFIVAGAPTMDVPLPAVAAVVAIGAGLLGAPRLLPWAVAMVNRLTGRRQAMTYLPPRAVWWAAAGTSMAWVFYGIAFQFFAIAVTGGEAYGALSDWTAVFVGSYLLGFIAVFSPGGLGVREVAMAEALQRTGLAIGAVAALLVAASRIWLTVLEIIPGVLFLLVRPLARTDFSADR
ncbi:MAG: lysylphosphatidylglycerol synthase domain-containing protein [Gemmatimonadota bacterium]|nr:lysylphosphatidylglycerol synthase domain-containing protein [Gemmatimonadota bacterium]